MTDQPMDRDAAVRRVSELLDRNRFDHARRELARALEQFPNDADLLYYLGWLEWREDRVGDAYRIACDLLRLEPDTVRARYLMALVQIDRTLYARAEALLIDILRDDPTDVDVYATYAELMLRTLHVDKAERLAEEALRLDPDHVAARLAMLLVAIVNGREDVRDGTLAKMVSERPDEFHTVVSMVQVLHAQGRTREAERVAREIIAVQPDQPELVKMVQTLHTRNHWTMAPLWPVLRFGWSGSIAVWFGAVAFFALAPEGAWTDALLIALLVYVVYSWVWPPLLARWLRR